MTGIRERGGKYLIDVTVAGVRRTTTAGSLHEAKRAHADLRAGLLRDTADTTASDTTTWTLKQCLEKTKVGGWQQGLKSREGLIRNAEMVVEIIGPAKSLNTLTVEDVDTLIAELEEQGNSGGTINRKLAALSKMLTFAMDRGKMTRKLKWTRRLESEHRDRFYTYAEEDLILQTFALWGLQDHADVVQVLVDTGMRESELWRVTARDISQGYIMVAMSKRRAPRSVPMTQRVTAIIQRRITVGVRGPLFPYTKEWLSRPWNRMREHIGMGEDKQFIPYSLRHTCASRLIQRGKSLPLVGEWLGHTNPITTSRYTHLCPQNLMDAVSALERPLEVR